VRKGVQESVDGFAVVVESDGYFGFSLASGVSSDSMT